jgi:hypothetical protein
VAHTFEITVDGEEFSASSNTMTPDEILVLAGLSPADHYLVQIHGKKQDSFQGKGSVPIHLNEGAKFVSVFTGPTTVSHGAAAGAPLFATQLREVGYSVRELSNGHVLCEYTVEVGCHAGTDVKLGFQVPGDFPFTPPSGPHVSPHIHPIHPGGTHPTGGVLPSNDRSEFGQEFQYWSRPHPNWPTTKRRAADYMAFIRHLWATQ